MNADERGAEPGWRSDTAGAIRHRLAGHFVRSTALAAMLLAALLVQVAWTPQPRDDAPGRLIALVRDPVLQTEFLAYVNATTGEIMPFGTGLASCCTPVSLDAALDTTGRRYYAVMTLDSEATPRVVRFDADSGAATIGATLATTAAVNFLAYDPSTSRLLALLFDGGANRQTLAAIEPESGAVSWLGDGIENCCSIATSFDAALDDANRRLYAIMRPFTGTEAVFFTFDVDSGQVAAAAPLSSTASVNFFAYAAGSNALWAVANDPQSDAERLATLDPISGTVEFVGEGAAGCCNLFPTDAAIDVHAHHLVAPMLDGDAVARFYSFDLATGDVVHQPPVAAGYTLHFLAYLPAAPPPANSLYLPAIQRAQE